MCGKEEKHEVERRIQAEEGGGGGGKENPDPVENSDSTSPTLGIINGVCLPVLGVVESPEVAMKTLA